MFSYLLIVLFACNATIDSETTTNVPSSKTVTKPKDIDWKAEFDKRQKDYGYATADFNEFTDQLKECEEWFGASASASCLGDCAVFSLNRYSGNMEHPENARPVEPQVRSALGSTVCKVTNVPSAKTVTKSKDIDWKAEFDKRQKDYGYATADFNEFTDQLKECEEWFGASASTSCLGDCAVFSLNRYSGNMEHPENARPVEPQVRSALGSTVCK